MRRSEAYNRIRREATMKLAMLEPLIHPPAGFEEVVAAHFLSNIGRVQQQCEGWIAAAAESAQPRLREVRFHRHKRDVTPSAAIH